MQLRYSICITADMNNYNNFMTFSCEVNCAICESIECVNISRFRGYNSPKQNFGLCVKITHSDRLSLRKMHPWHHRNGVYPEICNRVFTHCFIVASSQTSYNIDNHHVETLEKGSITARWINWGFFQKITKIAEQLKFEKS